MRTLVAGATGYIGSELLPRLLDGPARVRALARDAASASVPAGVEVLEGDAVTGKGLTAALDGCSTAVYLIHSMQGARSGFAARDREAAVNFGEAAAGAGVRRVVYLGGLGSSDSEHLRSRAEVAELLRQRVPQLVHVRAAMVIGAGSASFVMLRHLVERLPVMVCPRWIDTRTQPVAVGDVVEVLAAAAERDDAPDELQVGGADVLTYREMMRRTAELLGRRPPLIVKVLVLTPRLSSYWVALITPVDAGLAMPLVEGLGSEMLVSAPPPPGFNDSPCGFDDAVLAALA